MVKQKKTVKPAAKIAKKTPVSKLADTKAKAVEKKIEKKVIDPSVETQADEKEKQDVISKFATRAGDTGSPEVQVAILTWKIVRLQKHLAENTKDNHSRRGLLKIISKRRRIMNYLKKKDEKRYGVLEQKIQGYQKA